MHGTFLAQKRLMELQLYSFLKDPRKNIFSGKASLKKAIRNTGVTKSNLFTITAFLQLHYSYIFGKSRKNQ
jgi:hypothetical protein